MGKGLFKNKSFRASILLLCDLIIIVATGLLSLAIRFDFRLKSDFIDYSNVFLNHIVIYALVFILCFSLFGLYRSLWRYASISEMVSVILSALLGNTIMFVIFTLLPSNLPRSFYIINSFLMIAGLGGLRFSYRIIRRFKSDGFGMVKRQFSGREGKRILIVGAGEAGVMTARELIGAPDLNKVPVGFLDDDINKLGKRISGIPILGDLASAESVVADMEIDEIVVAMPSVSNKKRSEILESLKGLGTELRTLPGIYEIIDGKVNVSQIRSVEIEDLLGREPIELDNPRIEEDIKGRTVLVTGGGGSIGSELCRQIAEFSPKTLIIFDIYENNAYDIQLELVKEYGDSLNLVVLIGSVRDIKRLEDVFDEHRPDLVFHAAAHKHVPLMQNSPYEAIKNNTVGTLNVAELSGVFGVDRFVLISTDKAVNPTNIMGASKRLAELVVQSLDSKYKDTEFVAVRFGNVLGSNGSVIPIFKSQVEKGGPITVTHPDIIRYFMTIPEAVALVLQAGSMASGGEIFILDMGAPVKIVDLAEDLIRLSGFEPYRDIDIEFTGLRPGEKLYEELLLDEEGIVNTVHDKIFIGRPLDIDIESVEELFQELLHFVEVRDLDGLESSIKKFIPKYSKLTK